MEVRHVSRNECSSLYFNDLKISQTVETSYTHSGEGNSSDNVLSLEIVFVYMSPTASRESRSGTVKEFKVAYSKGAARKRNKAVTGKCNAYSFLG